MGNKKENGFNEEFKGEERRSKNRRRKDEGQIEPKLFEKGLRNCIMLYLTKYIQCIQV